jgi:malate dehydrogenase (oxaloacetate-decarboxylating)
VNAQETKAHVPVSRYFDVKLDADGKPYIETTVRGIGLLRYVLLNKGSAFTLEERNELGLSGHLPPRISNMREQIDRAYSQYVVQESALAKYQWLRGLQERQEVLFYALVAEHLEEMLPIVYTPTVGEAIERFSALWQYARGLTVHSHNLDQLPEIVAEYPLNDIRVMVVTDSSAILGIGDQGYNGLGISIGKLTLYTVGGGVSPFHTMAVGLDVGTDHPSHLADPLYLGDPKPRLKGEAYDAFVEQFVSAIEQRWPEAIVQWEDLSKEAAFRVLARYRHRIACLNDDIQGTGAVTLAGVISACRLKNEAFVDQVFAVHGAGAGGAGVAMAIRDELMARGLSEAEAYRRIWVIDSRGLLIAGRDMLDYKKPFGRDPADLAGWTYQGSSPGLLEVVEQARVTVLLGLSGQGGAFTREVVDAMQRHVGRPVVFALSNPTRLAEARPSDLIEWTLGRAIVATGSPFPPVDFEGHRHVIGQGNNAFVFPGLGLAASVARVREITDAMVLASAHAVADYTAAHHPHLVYPPLSELGIVSRKVACAVLRQAAADGVNREPYPLDDGLDAWVEARFWKPEYLPIRRPAAPKEA